MTSRPRSNLADEVKALAAAGEQRVALLVDLSDVAHARDVRFLASLQRHVDTWIGLLPHGTFVVGGPKLLVLAAPDADDDLRRNGHRLAGLLHGHGFGRAAVTLLELPREFRELVAAVPEAAVPSADGSGFATFLDVERMLLGADIASLVREQPVCAFDDPAHPRPIFSELWVSLEELERRLGMNIRDDPQLLREVTELTDIRMLRHLLNDRSHSRRRFSINLHVATVMDPAFLDLADQLSTERGKGLLVELAGVEVAAAPERAAAAARRLRDLGMHAVLDFVPMAGAAAFEATGFDAEFVKLAWPGRPAPTSADLRAALERWGKERVVLCRCDDEEAVAAGLAAGIVLLQGRGVSGMLDHPGRTVAALASAGPPQEREGVPQEGPAGPARPGGWLSRLLRRS